MTSLKSPTSEQLCRVSLDGLSAAPSDQIAAGPNDGKAPLCDEYGRLVVVSTSSGPTPGAGYTSKSFIGSPPIANTRLIFFGADFDILSISGTLISGGPTFILLVETLGAGVPGLGSQSTAAFRLTNNAFFSLTFPSDIPLLSNPMIPSTNSAWLVCSSTPNTYSPVLTPLFTSQVQLGVY